MQWKKKVKLIWPGRTHRTVSLSSQQRLWYWAPTRESDTITIPTNSDSASHPQALSSSLSTSSETPLRQTYTHPKNRHQSIMQIEEEEKKKKPDNTINFCECLESGCCAWSIIMAQKSKILGKQNSQIFSHKSCGGLCFFVFFFCFHYCFISCHWHLSQLDFFKQNAASFKTQVSSC